MTTQIPPQPRQGGSVTDDAPPVALRKELEEELAKAFLGFLAEGQELLAAVGGEVGRLRTLVADVAREAVRKPFDVTPWQPLGRRLLALESLRQVLGHAGFLNREKLLLRYASPEAILEPMPTTAFVMSIDIRRSTELMLKAVAPERFSEFIDEVASALSHVVMDNDGIADKFTGDGLLAYFPIDVFGAWEAREKSGRSLHSLPALSIVPDPARTGSSVLKAAAQCHQRFATLYDKHAGSFTTIPLDVGLGIGVDYGQLHTATIADNPTIIGRPVVYACRLSSGPAGSTWLNVGAWGVLSSTHRFKPIDVVIKHEGPVRAWSVTAPDSGRKKPVGVDRTPEDQQDPENEDG